MTAEREAWLAKHKAGELQTEAEQLQAATALLPSCEIAEVELAHRLLLTVMASDPAARSLAAEAYDRLRLLRGQPQKFGTQSVTEGGEKKLWSCDPTTTDSERAKWGLPPLAELERRVHND